MNNYIQDLNALDDALSGIKSIADLYSSLSYFLEHKILTQQEYERACNLLRLELDKAIGIAIDCLSSDPGIDLIMSMMESPDGISR